MPEYDAFGREIDDDPLKALRQSAPAEPAPVVWPDPVAKPEPVIVTPEPGAPPAATPPQRLEFVRPRRRRSGGLSRLIVLAAIVGVAALVVGSAGVKVESGIDDIAGSLPTTVDPPPAATGIKGDSLIRRANFENAVAALKSAGLGRPQTMRVAPDRIDATLIGRGGRLHQVQVTPGGELRELGSSDGVPGRTIAYAAIDPSAPERLVRAGATKKAPASSINYLVVTAGPPLSWGAYYKGGRIVLGDAHGRKQRVL